MTKLIEIAIALGMVAVIGALFVDVYYRIKRSLREQDEQRAMLERQDRQ